MNEVIYDFRQEIDSWSRIGTLDQFAQVIKGHVPLEGILFQVRNSVDPK